MGLEEVWSDFDQSYMSHILKTLFVQNLVLLSSFVFDWCNSISCYMAGSRSCNPNSEIAFNKFGYNLLGGGARPTFSKNFNHRRFSECQETQLLSFMNISQCLLKLSLPRMGRRTDIRTPWIQIVLSFQLYWYIYL